MASAGELVTIAIAAGVTFGRLTVVERVASFRSPSGQTQPAWACSCECGGRAIVRAAHLRAGRVRSCGCLRRELAAELGKRESSS